MSETLAEFLTEQRADAATLQHAVRYLAGALSGDLPREAQRAQLAAAAGDAESVEEALAVLEQDSAVLLQADLAVLAAMWDEPDQQERRRRARRRALRLVRSRVCLTIAYARSRVIPARPRPRAPA